MSPAKPPQLISMVRMSPDCGLNMAPRIARPSANMKVREAANSSAGPVRFNKKCPPPGTSQPSATGGSHTFSGGIGSLAVFSFSAILFLHCSAGTGGGWADGTRQGCKMALAKQTFDRPPQEPFQHRTEARH